MPCGWNPLWLARHCNAANGDFAPIWSAGLAEGLKPRFDTQQQELQELRAQLESATRSLTDAQRDLVAAQQKLIVDQAELGAQQRAIDKRNTSMGVVWYVAGAATPIFFKSTFGIE
jgi:hypothetical protein